MGKIDRVFTSTFLPSVCEQLVKRRHEFKRSLCVSARKRQSDTGPLQFPALLTLLCAEGQNRVRNPAIDLVRIRIQSERRCRASRGARHRHNRSLQSILRSVPWIRFAGRQARQPVRLCLLRARALPCAAVCVVDLGNGIIKRRRIRDAVQLNLRLGLFVVFL